MAIRLTPIVHGDLCHGYRWEVADRNVLAERVARVALGQFRHVEGILAGLNVRALRTDKEVATDAKRKLEVAANGDPWHRDGWLFQTISWITANQSKAKGSAIELPHIFHAHKGFDGMQLDISDDGKAITAVVIFEDKATTDPRGVLRDDVWPTIEGFEAGERVSELLHTTTGLLSARQHSFPGLNVDEAIDRIVWQEVRQYRVSITTGKTHAADATRERLFDGFADLAKGDVSRRRAETMHFDDLRDWMTSFAVLVGTRIDEAVNV